MTDSVTRYAIHPDRFKADMDRLRLTAGDIVERTQWVKVDAVLNLMMWHPRRTGPSTTKDGRATVGHLMYRNLLKMGFSDEVFEAVKCRKRGKP